MPALDPTLPPPGGAPDDAEQHRAMEAAAGWYALLRSGEATDREHADWAAWRAASPAHEAAWGYVERVSRRFEPVRHSVDPRATVAVLQTAQQRAARRRQALLGAVALGGTGLLGWALWSPVPLPQLARAWQADHRTGTGEMRDLLLPDGTRIWLGPDSALDTDYSADLRRLQLLAGEACIETASDASRPFVVDTPQGRLRALGTRFQVRLDGSPQASVAVYEGAVEVRAASDAAVSVLRAGEQVRFGAESIGLTSPADPSDAAWTRGLLIARHLPLRAVVAELARYRRGHLGVAPEVAELRVVGSFPLRDTDRALAMLAGALPVQLRQPLPWWTTLEARPDAKPSAPR